jgi:hypothetical protein
MAESPLPDRHPSAGGLHPTVGNSSPEPTVNANTKIPRARPLAPPPRDVTRLLKRYGTSLPRYLDAQRWRDIGHSHQRWPLLWNTAALGPGGRR